MALASKPGRFQGGFLPPFLSTSAPNSGGFSGSAPGHLSHPFQRELCGNLARFVAGFAANCAETARAIALSPVIRPVWR
jgi:hypothetical protein